VTQRGGHCYWLQCTAGEAGSADICAVVASAEVAVDAFRWLRRGRREQPGTEHSDVESRGVEATVTAAQCSDRAWV